MKRISVLLLNAALILTLVTGCGASQGSATPEKSKALDIDETVINGSNSFAFDIFGELGKEDPKENVFISPISISTALTMTYNGAETSTRLAMDKVLGFENIDREIVNQSYKSLIKHLESIDKKISLNIGNSIWIREGQKIKESFIDANKKNFNAQVDILDFSKATAADTINGWIKNETNGKIEKMVDSPIDPDVILYLINAIYFKGQWSKQFDVKKTTDGDFHANDGSVKSVKMMKRQDTVEYAAGENYKAVRLPYGNGKTSMNIILPNEGTDINDYVGSMDLEKWKDIRQSINKVDDVNLQIPRFKIEYGIKSLNDSLKSLGMEEAFDGRADFSGIREDIFISRVLHKAVIEVNEEGSEAAAATVVEMRETGLAEPITFILDRPFIFFITDDVTGTILFMGKVFSI